MLRVLLAIVYLAFVASGSAQGQDDPVSRIAFGSCIKHEKPQHVWGAIRAYDPDVFLFIGDNVYADTQDMGKMRADYEAQWAVPGFAALRSECRLLGTWDDHDYGENDAGVEYPKKRQSQQVFLDFFGVPRNDPRRAREGVYHSEIHGPHGRRVQFILLDTRYHRSPLNRDESGRDWRAEPDGFPGSYVPNRDPEATLLGEAQRDWLEERLREPAELRIIATSIQFVAEDHGFEKWANLPYERRRMCDLIRETGASGVVFVSGDRHSAELSVLDPFAADVGSASDPGYPIYDLTSSALTNSSGRWWNEHNRHRLGSQYTANNFGTITIDWQGAEPVVSLQLHADDGEAVLVHRVPLRALGHGG